MCLRDQGIDDYDGVGRVIRSRGISDNDGGVGRGRGIQDTFEGSETMTEAEGVDGGSKESTTTTEVSKE